MIVYRLVTEKYKDDLSGTGSKLYGGRWNTVGIPALYTAEHISLSVLEIIAHAGPRFIPPAYFLMRITIPPSLEIKTIDAGKLKQKWYTDAGYTQFIGNSFLKESKAPVLKVPSVLVTEEFNYIINPVHPESRKIKIHSGNPFNLDIRLIQK